jgi:hypothetical protein
MHHPFAHSKPALKSNFFLGGINGMCQHRASKKKQLHVLICMTSLAGYIRLLSASVTGKIVRIFAELLFFQNLQEKRRFSPRLRFSHEETAYRKKKPYVTTHSEIRAIFSGKIDLLDC